MFSDLEEQITPILATTFGYYSLQIGCSQLAQRLQESCRVKHQFTLDDLQSPAMIRANPSMLPVASDSVDLVILMHHLSNTSEPHAILREAFRILIPEGKLVIIDFNPMSLWGLRHFFQSWLEHVPFKGHLYTARRIDDWMRLLGFDQDRHYRVGYLPPIQKASVTRHMSWFEKGSKKWLPMLGVLNLMIYSKNISPLTPVRHRWVTRKILPGKIARPSVGRNMKYDR
ncbi:MAG: class I SAM-dependent methyltransferase [Gammaproteobacteria bacterium]|nr:class I SAM-dependent methyltransferase [Gammaproteobacteria bacterium]MDH3447880.1 class I SAM-dependent methyltransferase [Gammaproteobacteria bacterium]